MSGAEGQSRTDTGLPRPVFECGTKLRVKGYYVLQRVDFDPKTSPDLEPHVVRWWNVRPHLGDILAQPDE